MLTRLRKRIALAICPELDPWSGHDFDRAFRTALKAPGFFDIEAARAFRRAQRSPLGVGRTGQVAQEGDLVGGAAEQNGREPVTATVGGIGLSVDGGDKVRGEPRVPGLQARDQAHQDRLGRVRLVLQKLHGFLKRDRHSSLHPVAGASDGRGGPVRGEAPPRRDRPKGGV